LKIGDIKPFWIQVFTFVNMSGGRVTEMEARSVSALAAKDDYIFRLFRGGVENSIMNARIFDHHTKP